MWFSIWFNLVNRMLRPECCCCCWLSFYLIFCSWNGIACVWNRCGLFEEKFQMGNSLEGNFLMLGTRERWITCLTACSLSILNSKNILWIFSHQFLVKTFKSIKNLHNFAKFYIHKWLYMSLFILKFMCIFSDS